MSIESVMPSSHLILCRPLLLLPPIPPSIRVFSNESTLHMRWPKYWSFSSSIIPSKEIPGLISFRMDWLDLFAVQGTLKSLLQHHSSKVSILLCSAFVLIVRYYLLFSLYWVCTDIAKAMVNKTGTSGGTEAVAPHSTTSYQYSTLFFALAGGEKHWFQLRMSKKQKN